MEFLVDKRTELMSIILALSQGNEYIEEHFSFNVQDEYRQKVYNYFSKFKHHKCIQLAKRISENDEGFNFDNPIRLAFSLNENLEFEGIIEDYLLKELENEKLLKEFMKEVVNFAKDSNFEEFYNLNYDYYSSKVKELKQLFNAELFICELQKFLKVNAENNFNVNIIPMLINANHGFKVDNINFANIGMISENLKTIDEFNNGTVHTIIHEFAHTFVNCYTERSQLQIPKNLEKTLKNMGYGNPIAYLNDTIVRAITIRLREKIQNIDIQKFFEREDKFGFVYVKKVYQELVDYEKQSLSWEEYFHRLISSITKNEEIHKII